MPGDNGRVSEEPQGASGAEPPQHAQEAAGAGELQFETASFSQPVAFKSCSECQHVIADLYFESVGKTLCPACRDRIETPQRWDFWRALLFGGLAGAAGTLVWSLIIYTTGYELGIIAIFLGVCVGLAVRKGARGRGGWKYQALAMVLTYLSITTSYVPMVWKSMVQGMEEKEHAAEIAKSASAESEAPDLEQPVAAEIPKQPAAEGGPHGTAAVVVALGFLWGLALAAPFLGGLSNILGLIIIGIGLYEAWKINRRVPVSGPFQVVLAPPPLPAQPGTP